MGVAVKRSLLGSLINLDILDQATLDQIGTESESVTGDWLVKQGYVTPVQVAKAEAHRFDLEYVDLRRRDINTDLLDVLPLEICNQLNIVPFDINDNVLTLVIENPSQLDVQHRVEFYTGYWVSLAVSDPDAIKFALAKLAERHDALKNVADGMKLEIVLEDGEQDRAMSLEDYGEHSTSPIVRLINTTILSALRKRASDIHVEVYDYGIEVKYRIDGILYPATEILDSSYHATLISRLKIMGELDIAEKRVPQDGRFKLRVQGRDVDFRLSIIPTAVGESAVIRVLDNPAINQVDTKLTLDRLGLPVDQLKAFRRSILEPYGMVLIAGPTGSGKTTTIYSALSELNTGREKIITIEDPVEYQLDGVMQIAVNEKKGLTFSSGLRSVLRHDPDKILVGEIRDSETAEIAVRSALTGHLVFSTVHANNAIEVIFRFQNMGLDLFNFISSLNCVVAQRLVRLLCGHCKSPVRYESHYLEEMGISPDLVTQPFYVASGCELCEGTGYKGRRSIAEMLLLNEDLRKKILEKGSVFEAIDKRDLIGGVTLRSRALNLVIEGISSLDEVNRVTFVD
ncbi:MAG: Flp pilus assembly complex ATPase component TadA [Pseudomonadales bacterium]|nr:Flp pilus assembly complex ATPase component TadA [Pseudomonadales bacterium]